MALIWPAQPMRDPDIYVTDFSEYPTGAKPSDWTQRWDTTDVPLVQSVAGSLSGNALRWTKTGANRQGLSWNRVPAAVNCEILIRARAIEAFGAGEIFARSVCRSSGAAGAESGYVGTIGGGGTNNYFMNVQKYVVSTGSTIIANTPGPSPSYIINIWVWLRFRVIGTTLAVKIWQQGSSEPGSFGTVTDTSLSAGGWIGLGIGGNNPDAECDFFSVALNGKTAPSAKR